VFSHSQLVLKVFEHSQLELKVFELKYLLIIRVFLEQMFFIILSLIDFHSDLYPMTHYLFEFILLYLNYFLYLYSLISH